MISKGFVERGAFNGCKFEVYSTILSKNEEFGIPNKNQTDKINNKNYSKLNNIGIVERGTLVKKGDVLIGKYISKDIDVNIKNNLDINKYEDKSVIYKESEPAIVHNIIVDANNTDSNNIRKVVLRKMRPISVGDKFCCLPTQQIMTTKGWINIVDIDVDKHYIATLSKDGHMIYEKAIKKYKYKCNNEILISYKDDNVEFTCTSNHDLCFYNFKSEIHKIEAQYLSHMNLKKYKIVRVSRQTNKNYYIGNLSEYENDIYILLKSIIILCNYNYYMLNDNKICVKSKNHSNLKYYLKMLHIDATFNDGEIIINEDKNNKYSKILLDVLFEKDMPSLFHNINNLKLIKKLELEFYELKTQNYTVIDILSILFYKINYVLSIIRNIDNSFIVSVSKEKRELYPILNKNNINKKIYNGYVYCLEMSSKNTKNVYFCKENVESPPIVIGNSSRSGQKGVCARLMDDADMPYTEDGIIPGLIINPHCIPTRMTIGQLMESLTGINCSLKCGHIDCTIFSNKDLHTIYTELKLEGYNQFGYKRLYSGITGEAIDALVFMGPTYYQRLQKFISELMYSIVNAPTDMLTMQPLEGKSSGGISATVVMKIYC